MFSLIASKLLTAAGDIIIPSVSPGFTIPNFGDVLTFMVRIILVGGGLIALIYLLLGAVAWITSGGNKESVDKAREKIQNAIIGLVLIVVVLSVVGLLEQILNIGLGIFKPITITPLVK